MCRNIRVLYNFEPPTTKDEIRAAAVQYVRKVSGLGKPSAADAVPFEKAALEIAASTERLLQRLQAQTAVRTREAEREKARARWSQRVDRVSREEPQSESAAQPHPPAAPHQALRRRK